MHEQENGLKRVLETAGKPRDFITRRMLPVSTLEFPGAPATRRRPGMASSCYTAARFPTMTVNP
jgi:hypothetical protein